MGVYTPSSNEKRTPEETNLFTPRTHHHPLQKRFPRYSDADEGEFKIRKLQNRNYETIYESNYSDSSEDDSEETITTDFGDEDDDEISEVYKFLRNSV